MSILAHFGQLISCNAGRRTLSRKPQTRVFQKAQLMPRLNTENSNLKSATVQCDTSDLLGRSDSLLNSKQRRHDFRGAATKASQEAGNIHDGNQASRPDSHLEQSVPPAALCSCDPSNPMAKAMWNRQTTQSHLRLWGHAVNAEGRLKRSDLAVRSSGQGNLVSSVVPPLCFY